MTKKTGPKNPPVEHRFQKGKSGNPGGRPRKKPEARRSAFDIIVDKTLTKDRSGVNRDITIEEALQHKIYRDAIGGDRSARREVLKMIAKREKWLAGREKPKHVPVETRLEPEDPDNAHAALLLLGIASRDDPPWTGTDVRYERLLLEPWAVQMAISRRRGGTRLSEKEVSEIKRCTRAQDTLHWPRSVHE